MTNNNNVDKTGILLSLDYEKNATRESVAQFIPIVRLWLQHFDSLAYVNPMTLLSAVAAGKYHSRHLHRLYRQLYSSSNDNSMPGKLIIRDNGLLIDEITVYPFGHGHRLSISHEEHVIDMVRIESTKTFVVQDVIEMAKQMIQPNLKVEFYEDL